MNNIAVFFLAISTHLLFSYHANSQEKDFNAYSEHDANYLKRIFSHKQQPFAFRSDLPGGFEKWQQQARAELINKIGLQKIAQSAADHQPQVTLGLLEDLGQFFRQSGTIETEPDVSIPFWILKPKTPGPWPLAVFPHGHDSIGYNTTAGVYTDDDHKQSSLAADRDVAVQAVKLGFFAIAPATRGLTVNSLPDLHGRHGKQRCRSQAMHCLLAGRTAIGERVWDMQRLLDWAIQQPQVDARHTLMMGNSGGGMVTIFTTACDQRIKIAVPSCSFAPTISESGYIFHCDCNMVPGLIELGGLPNVAGLIAPRKLLAVNGRQDSLFNPTIIDRAVATTQTIYTAAGYPANFQHRWGDAGHRFYAHLMWPYITKELNISANDADK